MNLQVRVKWLNPAVGITRGLKIYKDKGPKRALKVVIAFHKKAPIILKYWDVIPPK